MIESDLRAEYDLCVIGGGINGAGIARDAAGRGLSVLLVEARDLAGATSSASTKLIHGGLRYLEYYEFHLVRESLKERERLLSIAPHIIRPLRFVLPHDRAQRPRWLIRLGLFLYDHLVPRKKLAASHSVDFGGSDYGDPLSKIYKNGFVYSDCWADDSRLVVLNAISAAQKGATIMTHTRCEEITRKEKYWQIDLLDGLTGEKGRTRARAVVNATGPWVRRVLDESNLATDDTPNIKLVKGSHIIIPRAYEGDHAYILQQPDRRIVFVIPYEHDFTLIGTTEESFSEDPYEARISEEEINYLCEAYNRSFGAQISRSDMLWTYSGVRPLFDDGGDDATAVTRDFVLHEYKHEDEENGAGKIYAGEIEEYKDKPFLLSVFGGKLTTYRVLAEQAVQKVVKASWHAGDPRAAAWTASEALPGGDISGADFNAFLSVQAAKYDWLSPGLLERYARSYGTLMDKILFGAQTVADLGEHYGDNLYEAEVKYLVRMEWARTAEDVLWRRSKLGLHVSDQTVKNLEAALPAILKRYETDEQK